MQSNNSSCRVHLVQAALGAFRSAACHQIKCLMQHVQASVRQSWVSRCHHVSICSTSYLACKGHPLSKQLCRRYDADKKIISGTGALYALLAIWGLMLPLTAGTRPVIGGMSSCSLSHRAMMLALVPCIDQVASVHLALHLVVGN